MENNVTEQIYKIKGESAGGGGLILRLPVSEYRSVQVPGVAGAKMGSCFVRVTDLPTELDSYMEINPRVPSRSKKGVLSGPVVKGILETLRELPEEMALKNQGIYVLVESAEFFKGPSTGKLKLRLSDKGRHGIVNGGHTYAAIREALEAASEEELETVSKAYVRLHILQGIEADMVPEIAEGLNRSRQVDDPSLMNLQGEFDVIRKILRGSPAEHNVAYHQGDEGEVYISELLVYLSMFDSRRFDESSHPNSLYNRHVLGQKYFAEDLESNKRELNERIKLLPDILWLVDNIRKATPEAARLNKWKFGMAKVAGERLGGKSQKGSKLPFIGESMAYRVPNGWLFPMLAAFRANLDERHKWRLPIVELLPSVMMSLAGVLVAAHKDSGGRPELIGKKEAAYSSCYTKMQLYLSKKGVL